MSIQLIKLQEKCGVKADGIWGPSTYKAARDYFKLSNIRAAHFFGQCAHETGNFTLFEENLNYSAEGLVKTWPSRFTPDTAKAYARKPEMIANKVYANRMGNGDESSGDGWKYRGRGAIQLTGKENYSLFGHATEPNRVSFDLAFESGLFFFNKNKLWSICDKGTDDATIKALRIRVNGGTIGLADVIKKTQQYAKWG